MSLGLLGTLEMSKRALDTARQGIELTGHNLSNVSNPAYARQRLRIQTSPTLPTPAGPAGTGSQVVGIEQLRSKLLDTQIIFESSVSGRLEAQQRALQFGEVNLGQQIDRQANTPEEIAAAIGIGGQFGLVEGLSDFFNALQALTTNPTSTADRQVVLLKAENLTDKFNSISRRMSNLRSSLNTSVQEDVATANQLLKEIADVSRAVTAAELGEAGSANDLKDRRQLKLEELAKIVNIQTSINSDNTLNLSISGTLVISENNVIEDLTTYTDAQGGSQLRSVNRSTSATTNLTLTSGGSILGTIEARDGALTTLKGDIDNLAGLLITQINGLHATGFALNGTNANPNFFTGSNASDIQLNTNLLQNPGLIQASAISTEPGNNQVALSMARLANQPQTTMNNLTYAESFNQSVATYGQALANVNSQLLDQSAVNRMLARQRDSIGGVSIDEEMANLVIFQRAFQASAKMVTTIDDLLESVIALAR